MVTQDSNYWYKDIDILATKDGITKSYEVKWDSRLATTGNIFIETISNISTDRKGWLYYCEADFLLYGDAAANTFYIIPMLQLKEHLATNYFREVWIGYT